MHYNGSILICDAFDATGPLPLKTTTTRWLMVSKSIPTSKEYVKKAIGMPPATLLPPGTNVTIGTDGSSFNVTCQVDGQDEVVYLTYGWRALLNPAGKNTQISSYVSGHNSPKEWPQSLLSST